MSILEAIVLGIIQGATEFVPVSSSGHLVLVPWLLGWDLPPLAFDTILHLGTLLAVLAYFWRDWWDMFAIGVRWIADKGWDRSPQSLASAQPNTTTPGSTGSSSPQVASSPPWLLWLIIVGTIPAAVVGFFLEDFVEVLFGEPVWVSVFMLVTAALLALSERFGRKVRKMDSLRWRDAALIGLGQAAAIAPGLSRSGATISVGLFRGLERATAARFSFLLSTPIILGAGLFQLLKLPSEPLLTVSPAAMVAGFLSAAVTGYLCIKFLLRYLQRGSLYPFAFYCLWVGLSCFIIFFLR
jgi:undecaprenyl-diphosphatase